MRLLFLFFILIMACSQPEKAIDIQGHRGARGLMPENTIPGFIKAIGLGVTTLELDLSVTKDKKLIVSHEPYFSSEFCLDSLGNRITKENERVYNIYQMTYEEVKKFDCGTAEHPRFPDQQKMQVVKPLLEDVLEATEKYISDNQLPGIRYNIELKTLKKADNLFHPTPDVFSDLVYEQITEKGLWERVVIQSFDFRTLQYVRDTYPEVKLALLIENDLEWKKNIDSLGFTPDIYSCNYQLLSRDILSELKQTGMLVVPWTINDTNEMKKMIDWGVDGIITDYPDRAVQIIEEG